MGKSQIALIGIGFVLGGVFVWLLSSLGASVNEVQVGPLKFGFPTQTPAYPTTCESYGIKITSPQRGAYLVGQEFDVYGSFILEPPKDSVWLIYASPDGRMYWPQFAVETDTIRKTWKGKFIIGGDQPVTAEIVAALIGKPAQVLFDYFKKAGSETWSYPPIEKLTDDVVVCDRVTVIRTKTK